MQFTHAANYHAGLVIRNALFRLPVRVNNDVIPWVTYTEPELAQTGLSEAEARKRGIKIRILRWPYHDNDRAQAERETHGHIKVITTTKGKILGATIVGAQAGELIATWTLAIAQGLNIRAFTGIVLPYPTLSEIGKARGHRLFHAKFDEPLGAAHHSLAANLRLRRYWNREPSQRAKPVALIAPRQARLAPRGLCALAFPASCCSSPFCS